MGIVDINKWLGENHRTVSLYKEIEQKMPVFAKAVYHWAKEALFVEKEYDIAAANEVAPDNFIRAQVMVYNLTVKAQNGKLKAMARRRFDEDVIRYMKIQTESGNPEKAKKAKRLALNAVDSEAIRGFILDH